MLRYLVSVLYGYTPSSANVELFNEVSIYLRLVSMDDGGLMSRHAQFHVDGISPFEQLTARQCSRGGEASKRTWRGCCSVARATRPLTNGLKDGRARGGPTLSLSLVGGGSNPSMATPTCVSLRMSMRSDGFTLGVLSSSGRTTELQRCNVRGLISPCAEWEAV